MRGEAVGTRKLKISHQATKQQNQLVASESVEEPIIDYQTSSHTEGHPYTMKGSVRIRLARFGRKRAPVYNIVVARAR